MFSGIGEDGFRALRFEALDGKEEGRPKSQLHTGSSLNRVPFAQVPKVVWHPCKEDPQTGPNSQNYPHAQQEAHGDKKQEAHAVLHRIHNL